MKIIHAVTSGDIGRAKALFLEYAASLGFELCFQSFDEELAGLPGEYAPPSGVLLIAVEEAVESAFGPWGGGSAEDSGKVPAEVSAGVSAGGSAEGSAEGFAEGSGEGFGDGEAMGCVALRRLDTETCEMKRLYVRPPSRGKGIGRTLVETTIGHARRIGYKRMRLDAIRNMTAAVGLYTSMGFEEIAPYRHNPIAGAVYMELSLE